MSASNSVQMVQKLWSFRNVLRDNGVSLIEYVERRRESSQPRRTPRVRSAP